MKYSIVSVSGIRATRKITFVLLILDYSKYKNTSKYFRESQQMAGKSVYEEQLTRSQRTSYTLIVINQNITE